MMFNVISTPLGAVSTAEIAVPLLLYKVNQATPDAGAVPVNRLFALDQFTDEAGSHTLWSPHLAAYVASHDL